jgi:hypothetical protein
MSMFLLPKTTIEKWRKSEGGSFDRGETKEEISPSKMGKDM